MGFSLSFTKILCISYLPFMVFLVSCLLLSFLHLAQFWLIKSGYFLKIDNILKKKKPNAKIIFVHQKIFTVQLLKIPFRFALTKKKSNVFKLDIINSNKFIVFSFYLAAISHQLIGSFHHNFEPFQINRDPDKRVLIDS